MAASGLTTQSDGDGDHWVAVLVFGGRRRLGHVSDQPPRFLDHDLGRGDYTHNRARAAPGEGECLTRAEQEALSARARRDWIARRRQAWVECVETIDVALTSFAAVVAHDRAVLREVRLLRRGVERVSQRVASG
jgi:hypothetical protein